MVNVEMSQAQERIERNKEWKRRREEAEQLGGGKDGRSKVGELQNVIIYSRIICVRSLGSGEKSLRMKKCVKKFTFCNCARWRWEEMEVGEARTTLHLSQA